MRIGKIRTARLARFSLYNSPAWLKTRSDGADVAVSGGLRDGSPKVRLKRGPLMTSSCSVNRDKTC